MPFINTKASCPITKAQEETIKTKLGEAITALGKSESWLMVNFEDNCRLYFRGENSATTVFVEIALFGKASDSQYDAMTSAVTDIICDELGAAPDRVYVKYEEVSTWGWNGNNF